MDHDHFDAELLRRIADFASNTMRDPVQSPQIIKVVEERVSLPLIHGRRRALTLCLPPQLSGVAPRQVGNLAPGPLPPSFVPRNFRKLKFMDIDPLELARQLTIMDGRLFAKITPQECLGKAWPKEYGSEAANISAMIDMSNAVRRRLLPSFRSRVADPARRPHRSLGGSQRPSCSRTISRSAPTSSSSSS